MVVARSDKPAIILAMLDTKMIIARNREVIQKKCRSLVITITTTGMVTIAWAGNAKMALSCSCAMCEIRVGNNLTAMLRSTRDMIMERSTVFAAIRYRRSVREYDPRPIEDWKLDILLESARLAPSSTNSQPWRIIVVKNPDTRKQLSLATPGGINHHYWMVDAPVVLVMCAIKSNVQKFAQLIGKNYHLVDIGIAGEHVVLAATELGLGTCWVGWIDKKRVRAILGIPAQAEIVCLIGVGYPKNGAIPVSEMTDQFAAVEPRQENGEIGIGGIAANKRKSLEEIIFHEKVNA